MAKILNFQIIFALLTNIFFGFKEKRLFIVAVIALILLVFNYLPVKNKYFKYSIIWLNIFFLPNIFCDVWLLVGNSLLALLPQMPVLTILLLWCIWLVILLPVTMVSVIQIKNWFLRLIAFLAFFRRSIWDRCWIKN